MTDEHPRVARFPTWLINIDATLPITSQYILHGNLRDRFLLPRPTGGATASEDQPPLHTAFLGEALWRCLESSGFRFLLWHHPGGMGVWPNTPDAVRAVLEVTGRQSFPSTVPLAELPQLLRQVATHPSVRGALVLDYVSQWRPAGEPPSADEHALMQTALTLVHQATGLYVPQTRESALHNAIFWLVDRPSDLPGWLTGGSEGIRQVPIPQPDLDARTDAARILLRDMSPDGTPDPAEVARFARSTEGMTLRAMYEVVQLGRDRQLPSSRIEDAVRAHRVGLVENPWAKTTLRDEIRRGADTLSRDVMGQQRAIHHAVDILTRSTMGLTSAQTGGTTSGPRGVMFFAGPTGVGKTELAKAITRLIFGDERAYIRLDMSEFSSEHTEARLIGSPPGYVGHGAGGDLTNAVRRKPHSLVLFDEIEKAHPKILDKFLQILSDGRLTDGSGSTVHFSETVIVFTSNEGVRPLGDGEVPPTGEEHVRAITEAVKQYFTERLGRPELLGRLGDNIVVFDYISPEIATALADKFIANVVARVAHEQGLVLTLSPEARDQVLQVALADLSKGGRGIGLAVESALVNPLARTLIQHPGVGSLRISAVTRKADGWYELSL